MDQIAALHWLRDNVKLFGGSPSNITLMGIKRGAIFVNLLMLSPLAKGKPILERETEKRSSFELSNKRVDLKIKSSRLS